MSKTLLRGLELIEEVDRGGPLTVGELARRTGVHLSVVSRTVSALDREGWLAKSENLVSIGARASLLGLSSPEAKAIRAAEPMVRALTGVTGLSAQAAGLVGGEMMVLTSFEIDGSGSSSAMIGRVPLYVLAAGRAVAAQLPAAKLDDLLPADPYLGAAEVLGSIGSAEPVPAYLAGLPPAEDGAALPRNRAELDRELEEVRGTGFSRDHGELHPAIHCIAVPWPTAGLPAAFACFGTRTEIEGKKPLAERCLLAAARPGAEPTDVAAAASAG
jgi:DNA-binding IclR family transcriptional regulator